MDGACWWSGARVDDPADRRRTTVGRPLWGAEARTVDARTAEQQQYGPETDGEVAVHGPNDVSGQARMSGETARSASPEGSFPIGDLGVVDEEGALRIVGRDTETILRGGCRRHPREVEDRLRSRPAVDDACVIGVPHHVVGELVGACVVPVAGTVVTGEELHELTLDTMADLEILDLARFFDTFPTTGSGKVKRRELERAIALDHTAMSL